MKFNLQDKLIHQVESPQSLFYRTIFFYTLFVSGILFLLAVINPVSNHVNLYFIVNLFTVFILTWFIRRSFHIAMYQAQLTIFRLGLFLLLNSTLATMAGGLRVLDKEQASLIAAILYAPAIILVIYSFNQFISIVNNRYKSAVELCLTDELTGLPNRRHLNIKLKELETQSGLIGVIDIDDFKKINDNYGHETGDKVLKSIGLTLMSFSGNGIFISRSGGEEFAVIISDENNISTIEKIKCALAATTIDGITITASIGAASKLPHHTSSHCLAAADAALYESKRQGKNRITFSRMENPQ